MPFKIKFTAPVIFALLFSGASAWGQLPVTPLAETGWERASKLPLETGFVALSKDSGNAELIFLASRKNLYRSGDGGETWKSVFLLFGKKEISSVYCHDGKCFLILDREILFSADGGEAWETIPFPHGVRNANVLSNHPEDDEILLLGTEQGLYWSLDNGRNWSKQKGSLGRRSVRCILNHPQEENLVFIATPQDLYRSDNYGNSFVKTFHLAGKDAGNEAQAEGIPFSEETPEKEGSLTQRSSIVAVKASPENPEEILLATSRGVFISYDSGQAWAAIPQNGLAGQTVSDLEISSKDGTLFAAASNGIYRFARHGQSWTELYQGLVEKTIGKLVLIRGKKESLLTASRHSLFRWRQGRLPAPDDASREYSLPGALSRQELTAVFAKEPSVLEIQKAAIRYNGVGNGKIARWHMASRLKAFIPDLSFNKYLSSHNTIDLDRGGTNDPDCYILGPESSSKSNSLNFSWDLKDFIWSSDQTSIDSRQKLMVELREELLSEITRLYFERRRLLADFLLNPPEAQKDSLEALLRIEELTAYLDGMTGGYLTKELEKRGIKYT